MALTFTHVFASLGSNTKGNVAFLADSSTMIKKRLTEMYFHSELLPSSVRAPHTRMPLPVNGLIALTDLPVAGSIFISSCSASVIKSVTAYTELRETLAGAFHTPLEPSTFA